MRQRLDMLGQRFGKLVVVEARGLDEYGHSIWLCRCDCGNQTVVMGSNLVRGNVKSCGCLARRRKPLPEGFSSFALKDGDPRLEDKTLPKNSICGMCGNYFCSWLQKHEPVAGWTAFRNDVLSGNRIVESYFVVDCPEKKPMNRKEPVK